MITEKGALLVYWKQTCLQWMVWHIHHIFSLHWSRVLPFLNRNKISDIAFSAKTRENCLVIISQNRLCWIHRCTHWKSRGGRASQILAKIPGAGGQVFWAKSQVFFNDLYKQAFEKFDWWGAGGGSFFHPPVKSFYSKSVLQSKHIVKRKVKKTYLNWRSDKIVHSLIIYLPTWLQCIFLCRSIQIELLVMFAIFWRNHNLKKY